MRVTAPVRPFDESEPVSTVPPAEGPDESPSDAQWEAFLRDAAAGGAGAPKEPSARARSRLPGARIRRPRRPGRMRSATAWLASAAPWLAVGAVVVFGAFQMGLIPLSSTPTSGPAKAVPLPGGGTSDGDRCGAKGYHRFPLPKSATTPPRPSSGTDEPGPKLVLSHYGYEWNPDDGGRLTIGLLFATPGSKKPFHVSRALGGEGVAVEIEGPEGLVAGAHGLPVTWPSTEQAGALVDVSDGGGGEVTLPLEAVCPGHDGRSVAKSLQPPVDSHNTITGQPPYRMVVSLRDPAVGTLRTSLGLPAGGNLLSANNLVLPVGS
ncbi:hypothetical protein Shyhy01_58460 [Streptomyces hygroscopicus subsp. hygroscopicus]|nr:hypothetical protein Shyhy01_58460 [Streptomyces hygroscopicus subsp. hygroscopicus]